MKANMTIRRHKRARVSHSVNRPRAGFTLVEMVVVMAIVLVLAGLVLPAASSMWEERKLSSSHTLIQGMLQTGRSRAMRAGGVESGLFFFVDRRGVQRIVSIQQDSQHSGDIAWENVFRVTGDRLYSLPAPMRVVPRYVVDTNRAPQLIFSEDELANNDFENLAEGTNNAQRHRNFFTMVFSSEGQLLVRRDVLLLDQDNDRGSESPERGDITGLKVGINWVAGAADGQPFITTYFAQDDTITNNNFIPPGGTQMLPFLIFDEEKGNVAINFPSVDGLLTYNDALFNDFELAEQKRAYLLESAQPFYINRYTGAIIRGPLGENVP